jgi:hypothetical protein
VAGPPPEEIFRWRFCFSVQLFKPVSPSYQVSFIGETKGMTEKRIMTKLRKRWPYRLIVGNAQQSLQNRRLYSLLHKRFRSDIWGSQSQVR